MIRLLLGLLLGSTFAPAATYYVATTGSDAADGSIGTPWATLYKGGATMDSGDVLYVRGGFYNCTNNADWKYFQPVAGGVIVSNYPGESPVFANWNGIDGWQGNPALINVSGKTNVGVFGLTITNCWLFVLFDQATNCTFAYNTVAYGNTNKAAGTLVHFTATTRSNYIHDNVLHDNYWLADPQTDGGSLLQIGTEPWGSTNTTFARIEGNHIYNGGHDTLELQASYNIIRSNFFHNAPWVWFPEYQQYGGHREIITEPNAQHNLIEGNWCGYAGQPIANDGATGMEICSASNIVRGNISIWNQNYGITVYGKSEGLTVMGTKVYNNTVVWNSLGQRALTNYTAQTTNTDYQYYKGALKLVYATNVFVGNNLFAYNGNGGAGSDTNVIFYAACTLEGNSWGKNWFDSTNGNSWLTNVGTVALGDPLFINTTSTNMTLNPAVVVKGHPFDRETLVLSLQAGSPCIDAGQFLTTVTSGGSGTTLPVADAGFFFDGYGMVPGDTIQLEGQSSTTTITAADYGAKTLTLSSSLTWTNGQGVALAYNGSAPDMGAYEYTSGAPAPPATNVAHFGSVHTSVAILRP